VETRNPPYIILLTAKTDKEYVVQGLESGANDYMTKPCGFDELRARVKVGQRMLEMQSDLLSEISEHKRTEKRLRESEDKYKTLINTSPDSIALFDHNGRFLTVNPTMAKRFDLSQEELEGKMLSEIMPASIADKHIEKSREALSKKELVYFESERQGSYFQNYYIPVSTSDSQRTYQVISRDITEVKQAHNALELTLDRLNQAVQGTFRALSLTLEQRDAFTAGHQERVARLACTIAREMGMDDERVQGLYFAGMVHDIGKISVPAGILTKPTRLSEIEFALIKEHSQAGYNILKDIEFPWPIADVVLQHHERLNGSGYPQGLSGQEILPKARILAVADVVEAMSSHRPYRPGLGIDAALGEIEKNKGILYDPEAVDVCLSLFKEQGYTF
jgi:PAS domain S-box-containing protein/putative nucleotidyltransferase with HDIG domain